MGVKEGVSGMIEVLRKIWCFAGEEQRNIRKSVWCWGFFYAIFHMFQIAAIYVVVLALVDGSTSAAPAWEAPGFAAGQYSGPGDHESVQPAAADHAGYFMVAKQAPRTWVISSSAFPWVTFNDQSLGELTGIATTILDEVESAGAMVLVTILGGLINSAVMLLCVLFWDWRIGLLALAGMALYLLLLSRMEKQSANNPAKRPAGRGPAGRGGSGAAPGHERHQVLQPHRQGRQTGSVQALEDSRENNLAVEKLFTPLHLGSGNGPPPVQRGDPGGRCVAVSAAA